MASVAPTSLETYFLSLINDSRSKAGVKPLSFDGELLASSDAHSAWMDTTDIFSHTGANGSNAGQRMSAEGYGWTGWGENIAYVSGALNEAAVQQLHQNLMNSPGHRANLLKGSFEEIGIGLKQGTINGRSVVFVTENFGIPNATEKAESDAIRSGTAPVLTSYETFTYTSPSEAYNATISSWNEGDTIDLSAIDADVLQWGNQAFHLTLGFTSQGDELTVRHNTSRSETYIYGNTDHDTYAEFRITVKGLHTFAADDFSL